MTEEDRALANRLVLVDARHASDRLRQLGLAFDGVTFADCLAGDVAVDDRTLVQLVIGSRGSLSRDEALAAAAVWKKLRAEAPQAEIYVCLLGYDQDPREIWEFAEVRRHVRRWAQAVGIPHDIEAATRELEQFPTLIGTLAASGHFGEKVQQDTITRFRAKHGAVRQH